ncbi:MAG: arginine--tRNA ligase [Elusimicrobia bacterium CG06_land_8_20_14_3_00_38_11]|nr:MAG: arginine--tRNA ligase [Elusimicrobia bacterium CG06_land_8_20_14_3_00_38_11]
MLKDARKIIKKSLGELKIADDLRYTVEIPPSAIDGDVSTNVAILLSKIIKKNLKEIADEIIEKIKKEEIVADAKFESGFINIIFSDNYIYSNLIKSIHPIHSDTLNGKKILIEFVSANPTGPLHIGHGRGAAYGDSLSRLFEFLGAKVEREYYINDVGNQMEILAQSVKSHIDKKPLQDIGYKGKYIEDIAETIKNDAPLKLKIKNLDVKEYTINKILEWIKNDLEKFGVRFNNWFWESSLYKKNEVDEIIQKLKEKNLAYQKDGAVWFKSTDFSDDKDRVLVREDGRKTYLASDIAYHFSKYKRNFDQYIDIWGADHHGYVERMKGAVKAVGCNDKKLKIILYQLVNIIKDGKKVNMSTRAGEFIMLKEVMDEVGVDATRFFLLMRNSESHLDFDLDLAKKQTPENPVFYVQYAHARICSIFKEAKKSEVRSLPSQDLSGGPKSEVQLKLLKLKEERELIKKVLYFYDLLEIAARDYAPHYLTKYLQDIASCFHSYYNRNRVITENTDKTFARLAMCQAVKNVLKDGLNILGVSAPEKM